MKLLLLIALTVLVPIQAHAFTTPRAACACDPRILDPFEEPAAFATGAHAGKCIDSCRFRGLRLLSRGEKLRVANVRHHDGYRIAEFDPRGAVEIDIIFQNFVRAVSHVAFRVRFRADSPVILRSQLDPSSPETETTHDLVISVEAALPHGGTFDFLPAQNGDYLLAYRLITIEEARRWMIGEMKHSVQQYKMRVPASALPALLELAVKRSEERSFRVPYYLFSVNCSTSIFEMLDEVTSAAPPRADNWYARAWPIAGPFGTLEYLYTHRLIEKRLPDLSREMRNPRGLD